MSTPGWYPDPGGQRGQFRYWNGASWSAETTTQPQRTAPPNAGSSPSGQKSGRRRLTGIVVGLVALLVAVLLVVNLAGRGRQVAEDSDTSTPTVSAWDETSSPSASPSQPGSSNAGMVSCPNAILGTGQPRNGRLFGGGISVPALPGWKVGGIKAVWVHDLTVQTKTIAPTWVSASAVAALSVADGFEAPESAARQMMSCFADPAYYDGFTGRKDLSGESVTIDGKPGYHLASEIYINNRGPDIPGDRVDVVVIDVGSPESLAIYFSSATLGDDATLAEVTRVRADITVD